jgi:hypothetical protein
MPIIGKHHVYPYSNSNAVLSMAINLQLGRRSRLPLPRTGNRLVYQHVPHACFRRTSPQRFWFRGLWRKPGQRFAVCGGNPAWQIPSSSDRRQGQCEGTFGLTAAGRGAHASDRGPTAQPAADPELKASMANDLDAGNRVELGWLAGKVVALGRRRRSTRSSSPTGWGRYGSAPRKPLTHRWHTDAVGSSTHAWRLPVLHVSSWDQECE